MADWWMDGEFSKFDVFLFHICWIYEYIWTIAMVSEIQIKRIDFPSVKHNKSLNVSSEPSRLPRIVLFMYTVRHMFA